MPNTQAIRDILRNSPEGISTGELAKRLGGCCTNNLRTAIRKMPDAYIDRWEGPIRGQYEAVWCVVVPPDDCPHPTREVVAVRPGRPENAGAAGQGDQER